jgi:alkylation response protein AidB-like acyl-CoA dehydrogenase
MNVMLREIETPEGSHSHRPTPAELRQAMRDLLPELQARAVDVEKAGQVPVVNVEALRAAGLFRIVKPAVYGGYEYDFDMLVELVMECASACASTAWVYCLYAAHQWLLASFPEAAQREIWMEQPDVAICGSYAPAGTASLAEGGYKLSGRWHFASGCDNADWALCASVMPSRVAGQGPAPAFFLLPKSDYTIEQDWEVVGLCGTGSKTLTLDDVFVPDHRLLTFRETTTGRTPGSKVHANPGFGIPMLSNIPSCLAATAVGAATGALEHYLAATSARVTRGAVAGGNRRMAEFATVQLRLSDAAASVDAAREILLRDLRLRATTARSGGEITVDDRITSRRGQAFAVSLAIRAAEALNASTGGHGLALSNPVQRAWRDANAVGRHISLNWDAVGTMYGQMAFGLEIKGQY